MKLARMKLPERVYVDARGSYVLAPNSVERLPTKRRGFLTQQEWVDLDKLAVRAAEFRMPAIREMINRGQVLDIRDLPEAGTEGAGHYLDYRYAEISGVPLPWLTHSFQLSERALDDARRSPAGWSFSGYAPEASARRVGEMAEKVLVGEMVKVAGSRVAISRPGGPNWQPIRLVKDVLEMCEAAVAKQQWGPFAVYHGREWDRWLDDDYHADSAQARSCPPMTLRERIRQMQFVLPRDRPDAAETVRVSDHLDPLDLLAVYSSSHVARIIVGMWPTAVQWGDEGEFRVVAQLVPQVRRPDGIVMAFVPKQVARTVEVTPDESWRAKPVVYEEKE